MFPLPFAIVMFVVSSYWLSVVVMIARSRLKLGAEAGAVPRSARERWMWLLWVPTVFGWIFLPTVGYLSSLPGLRVSSWALGHPNHLINWLAVVGAILAYVFTVPCWLALGTNWSLAIVHDKKTSLITNGFYSRVRHPIYALGLLLMAATLVVAPSVAMFVVATSHASLVLLKTVNEEQHLRQRHGQAYADYCRQTGRFFPPRAKRC